MINDAGNASPVDQVFWNFINDAESPVSLTSSQKDAIAQAMTSIDPADSAAGDAFCGHLTSLNQVLRSTMTDTEADAIMGELQKHDVAYKNVASLMEVMNFLEDGAEILTAGAVYTDPKTVPTPQEVLAVTYDNWGAGKSDLYGVPSFDAVAGAAASGFDGTDPNANFYNIIVAAVTTAPDGAVFDGSAGTPTPAATEADFRNNLVALLTTGTSPRFTDAQTSAQTCVDQANGAPQIYKDRLFLFASMAEPGDIFALCCNNLCILHAACNLHLIYIYIPDKEYHVRLFGKS